tara:strand:+ start:4461 stop:4670 length:210 start_codon:yes stop_codon:yes gene_type:complete
MQIRSDIPYKAEKVLKILLTIQVLLQVANEIDPFEEELPKGTLEALEEIDDIVESLKESLNDRSSFDAG